MSKYKAVSYINSNNLKAINVAEQVSKSRHYKNTVSSITRTVKCDNYYSAITAACCGEKCHSNQSIDPPAVRARFAVRFAYSSAGR